MEKKDHLVDSINHIINFTFLVAGYGKNKYHRYVAIAIEDRSKVEERYEFYQPRDRLM